MSTSSTDARPRVQSQSRLLSSIALDIASVIGCHRPNLATFGEWAAAGLERARLTRAALDLSMNMQELPDGQCNKVSVIEEACDTVLISLEDGVNEDVLDSVDGGHEQDSKDSPADKVSTYFSVCKPSGTF